MKDDEAALYDLVMQLYREKKVSDELTKPRGVISVSVASWISSASSGITIWSR